MTSFLTIDDFELGKFLGSGRFGQVWLARHKLTGYILSLKIYNRKAIKDSNDSRNIRREVEVHQNTSHQNILRYYGHFYDSKNLYYIIEYAGNGDLFSLLKQKSRFLESEASYYILQILKALSHLHDKNIIHRDLKPENILIGCDNKLKLCDFGWSVCDIDKRRRTFGGTAEYLSPEMCSKSNYNQNVDIWGLGILCYEFVTGETPFGCDRRKGLNQMRMEISKNEIEYPKYLSDECIGFISGCTMKDPSKRMTISKAMSHAFIVLHRH